MDLEDSVAIGEKEARLARSRESVWWLQKVREVKDRCFLIFGYVFFLWEGGSFEKGGCFFFFLWKKGSYLSGWMFVFFEWLNKSVLTKDMTLHCFHIYSNIFLLISCSWESRLFRNRPFLGLPSRVCLHTRLPGRMWSKHWRLSGFVAWVMVCESTSNRFNSWPSLVSQIWRLLKHAQTHPQHKKGSFWR